jgi:hypothetical protein
MNRQSILAEFYESKEFTKALNKFQPANLRDDLKQEVVMVLCEMPEEKLIGLYTRKELIFYSVRIMLNLINSTKVNQRFYRLFRQPVIEFIDNFDAPQEEYNHEKDVLIEIIEKKMQDLTWYERRLLNELTETTMYKLSIATKIPYTSIYNTVKKIKEKLIN